MITKQELKDLLFKIENMSDDAWELFDYYEKQGFEDPENKLLAFRNLGECTGYEHCANMIRKLLRGEGVEV